MQIKIKLLFTVILFSISFYAVSQNEQGKEYILTFERDTIYGKTSLRAFYGFKFIDENGVESEIKPDEIYEFYLADGIWPNTYFESVILPGSMENRVFLKRLIDGKIKMFVESIELEEQMYVTYYLSKNNSKLIRTNIGQPFMKKKSHQQVRKLISDNEEIINEFDYLKGKISVIKTIIEKYNDYSK